MADVKVPSKLDSMSHTFQKAWYKKNNMPLPAHLQRASSADKVDTTRTKSMQQKSLAAYGATKGTRMGSAEGTGEEMKDTVKPLTRDQWSKVHAAQRAAKGTPLTKDQRMSAIARAVRKAQTKHDVPTLDNNDDHADIRHDHDLMHSVGVRQSYNEGFDPSPKEIAKMLVDKHGKNVTKDHIDDLEASRDSHSGLDHEEIMKHVKKMTEETKQEAEKLLGGPVRAKSELPAAKNPMRNRARNLARQAMKAGKSVTAEAVLPGTENPLENKMMDIASTRVTPAGTKMPTSIGQKLAKQALLKKQHPIAQQMGEAKDPGEYDYEGDMAMSQLKSVITNAQKLHDMMEPDTNLPEWVQSKITLAEDYIVTAANYMEGQMNEEVEQIDEDHAAAYDKHMTAHYNAAERGDWDTAETHAVRAEKAAAKHFKATGKKVYDPGYTGSSKHITQVKEEVEQIEEKYMGFKAVMAAAKKGGARNPAAVAASIGRKKYGKEKFQAMAAAGKKAANEEVEQVTEAEGSVPTTPKEKELAAHHGDPNRITYGDVIKARLKSAAAKKMGK